LTTGSSRSLRLRTERSCICVTIRTLWPPGWRSITFPKSFWTNDTLGDERAPSIKLEP
jgi:hypothetical protein